MLSGVKMRSDVHQIIPNESGTSQSLLQPGVCGAKGDVCRGACKRSAQRQFGA